ncbi:TPA: colicin-like pore-forming protein [Salmonella enterica]
MSGGDGRGPGNTGLGHNGGKPSGNINGSSGRGGHSGSGGRGHGHNMRAPTAAEVAGQFNSYGGTKINSSQVSNIRSDGSGGYSADIRGETHTVSSGGTSHTSNTVGGFSGVLTSGHSNGNGGGYHHESGGSGVGSKGQVHITSNPGWSSYPGKEDSYLPTNKDRLIKGFIQSIDDNSGSYTIHYTGGAVATVTVPDGDVNNMTVHYLVGYGPVSGNKLTRDTIKSFIDYKAERNELDVLEKASELIVTMGDKVGEYLGVKYKALAKEIADEIKNFQGRTIRSYGDAMASLNEILSNPGMKVYKGDKDALVNAWRQVNAQDMANKLGNMSRAFKVADLVMKVEKVREKSIEGYDTGDWGPLMLEVESWVLSGLTASVAISLFSGVVSTFLVASSLPATALMIAGIMVISYLSSFIDANAVDELNREIIPLAH